MQIKIGRREVGDKRPVFVIAEAGVNHNGDMDLAVQLIDVAAEVGADAVKFQTFKTENLVTVSAKKATYQTKNDCSTSTQFQMLKKLEFSETQFKKLCNYAKKRKIIFLSTAFDEDSVDVLSRLNIPAFKVPSGEITNFPYLKKIAGQKKPVILSTGMATMDEVRNAVTYLTNNGCKDIAILHCTTSYPASLKSVNLRAMDTLKRAFNLPVGYSDHTEGILVPIAAVAMGAVIIEKHITLDRNLPGPDHAASLAPDQFRQMILSIRGVEQALGAKHKKPSSCELSNRNVVRKSIVAAVDIPARSHITSEMLTVKRPGTGIEPIHIPDLIGKTVNQKIKKDTLISWDMVE